MEPDIDQWQELLLAKVAESRGKPVPPNINDAVRRAPRHKFLTRYKLRNENCWRILGDAIKAIDLEQIYDDQPLALVHPDGDVVLSAQSKPSFILTLLEWLEVRTGHAVLEVGSGSGWLLAVLVTMTSPDGRVYGIEILDDLVTSSRVALADLGFHVDVHLGDAIEGLSSAAPFDRVIFTAATPIFPAWLFRDVCTGGRIAIPIAIPGGCDCMYVLERDATGYHSLQGMDSLSVPVTGSLRELLELPHPDAGLREELGRGVLHPWQDLPGMHQDNFIQSTSGFRAYLSITNQDFVVFNLDERLLTQSGLAFGLRDVSGSLALATRSGVIAVGGQIAYRCLNEAMSRWVALNRPNAATFRLRVFSGPTPRGLTGWVQQRGDSIFEWRMP